MGMVYQWKAGSHVAIKAQVAGEELERIRTHNNGRLESADVVEAARPEDAPLHPAFEWDDFKAAEAYRVEQAKYIIRHVDVVMEKKVGEAKPIRAFVSVQRDDDRSYTSTAHALADPELRKQIVAAAWRELESWRARHAELVEFAKVFAVIEKAQPKAA